MRREPGDGREDTSVRAAAGVWVKGDLERGGVEAEGVVGGVGVRREPADGREDTSVRAAAGVWVKGDLERGGVDGAQPSGRRDSSRGSPGVPSEWREVAVGVRYRGAGWAVGGAASRARGDERPSRGSGLCRTTTVSGATDRRRRRSRCRRASGRACGCVRIGWWDGGDEVDSIPPTTRTHPHARPAASSLRQVALRVAPHDRPPVSEEALRAGAGGRSAARSGRRPCARGSAGRPRRQARSACRPARRAAARRPPRPC